MRADNQLEQRILDQALVMAEATGWENLRLYAVADELGLGLDAVHACYAQKDDLAEAWFDRADHAALRVTEGQVFRQLPVEERLQRVMTGWLDALQPHRRLTRGMLAYKLEPGHIHLQAAAVTRISRTVQWFRESARQDSHGLRRIVEETALSAIFLATFTCWLFDDTQGSQRTHDFLQRALQSQSKCAGRLFTCGEITRPDVTGHRRKNPARFIL